MAVYCAPRTDEDVFAEIGDAKEVLLVGCPSCANMSCAIHRQDDRPVVRLTPTGIKAVCMKDEMLRLSGLLEQRGASVQSWLPNLPGGLCALAEGARKKLFEQGHDRDTIVTLSCESGKKNVESILPDSRVVPAMHAKGLLRVVTRKSFGRVLVDKKTVDILDFTLAPLQTPP
jgi:hypothetical protein